MKVTITKAEIVSLLNDKYGVNLFSDDLTIASDRKAPVHVYIRGIYSALKAHPAPSEKIAAIKHLREFCSNEGFSLGLCEAKYAVESPAKALEYCKVNNVPMPY